MLTSDIETLLALETCLAGKEPSWRPLPQRHKQPLPPVCDQIAELHERSVFGPRHVPQPERRRDPAGTRRGRSAAPARRRGRRAAGGQAAAKRGASTRGAAAGRQRGGPAGPRQFQGQLVQVALQYGITSVPRLDDPQVRQPRRLRPEAGRARRRSASATCSPTGTPLRSRPPATGPDRLRAPRGDRLFRAGRRRTAFQAPRRQLQSHRRAGRGRTPAPGSCAARRAAARRRRHGDGADPPPHPAAPAAAASPRGRGRGAADRPSGCSRSSAAP